MAERLRAGGLLPEILPLPRRGGLGDLLRILLRSVEKALQGPMGAEDAKEFVKRIGQELMGS